MIRTYAPAYLHSVYVIEGPEPEGHAQPGEHFVFRPSPSSFFNNLLICAHYDNAIDYPAQYCPANWTMA